MTLVATIISRIFEPFVMFSVVTLVAALHSGLATTAMPWFLTMLIVMIGLPIALLTWAIRTKKVDNWDVSRREQRIIPMIILLILSAIYVFAVSRFGNSELTNLFLLYFVWLVGFFVVTTKWKISGHTSANALAIGLLISWFGWIWWPLLLIVPLVAWARVVRKDHTVAQVVVGALYSWILVYVSFVFMNNPILK